ncbi:hypothetical protein BV898_14749 [Hypsibius exemplaris]|uniref:Uncharacterized protein n=1 Tax=Hypsibius exemplaris TaxID=2072580 RepID=A0A9X6RJS9_HYPEX|nr:hypothetical protein BV898_14749 [Hypsibius exemplaris]
MRLSSVEIRIVVVICACYPYHLLSEVEALPLNFRFSPKFDYRDDKSPSSQRKTIAGLQSPHRKHGRVSHPLDKSRVESNRTRKSRRRLRRDTSLTDQLDSQILEGGGDDDGFQVAAAAPAAQAETAPAAAAVPAEATMPPPVPPSAQRPTPPRQPPKPAGTSSEARSEPPRNGQSINWPEKLHNKHIFSREVQIIGDFPRRFPLIVQPQQQLNSTTASVTPPSAASPLGPGAGPETVKQPVAPVAEEIAPELERKRKRLLELKRSLLKAQKQSSGAERVFLDRKIGRNEFRQWPSRDTAFHGKINVI